MSQGIPFDVARLEALWIIDLARVSMHILALLRSLIPRHRLHDLLA